LRKKSLPKLATEACALAPWDAITPDGTLAIGIDQEFAALASKLMRRDQSQKCQRRRHVTGRDQERAVFEKRARAFSNLKTRSVSRNLIHL
jgi:hypothetical protein